MFLGHYLLTVLPIGLSAALCSLYPTVWSYALAAVTTGFAQNGLGLLMHEGSHGFFHARKNVNDVLADALVCIPIFNTVAGYRGPHLDHHRYAGSPQDPYRSLYSGYRSKWHLALCLLADTLAISAIAKFVAAYIAPRADQSDSSGLRRVVALVVVQGALFVFYTAVTGWWGAYFVLWVIPLMTMAQLINRIRTMAEHTPSPDGPQVNRGTAPGWLEYLLVAPYGYSFHFEHHLAPTIPYYQLSAAHKLLSDTGFSFTPSEVTCGYLREFVSLLGSIGSRS